MPLIVYIHMHLYPYVLFFSSLCCTMCEFAVEILKALVHGWNPVLHVLCHQVCCLVELFYEIYVLCLLQWEAND